MSDLPEIRIGTAERERALAELSEHYSEGRLTLNEFEERTEVVVQARFKSDLDVVFSDLPRAGATPEPSYPAPVYPAPATPPAYAASASTGTARWKTTVMALTPFVALIAFFLVKHWIVFLAIPIMGIILFAGDEDRKNRG
jgi:hypothetical protein